MTKRLLTAFGVVIILAGVIIGGLAYLKARSENATCTDNCNVLLISIDSLRADHVSSLGYDRQTTPNFDNLAKTGTLFTNYFSSTHLTPTSEISVQTGLYPTSNGVNNFDSTLPDDRMILPEYMKKLGYHTRAVLSSPEFEYFPTLKDSFSRGYDSYKYAPSEQIRSFPSIETVTSAFSAGKSSGQKSFTWLALGAVHWPFGQDMPNIYGDPAYNGPLAGQLLDWGGVFRNIYDGVLYPSKTKLTDSDIQYVRDQYDNGVRASDDFLGEVMQQLRKLKLDKKTIIVIESEHGEELGERGYFAHYDLLDNQTHTPLLIVDPRIKEGRRISSMAGSVDVLPTILDLLGTSSNNNLQGKSLAPLMRGSERDGQRKAMFMERVPLWENANLQVQQAVAPAKSKQVTITGRTGVTAAEDIAIRTGQWKYIKRLSKTTLEQISWWKHLTGKPVVIPEAELYDLVKDPGETKNVVADYPEVAAALNKQLSDWHNNVLSSRPKQLQNSGTLQPYQ